MKRDTLVHLLRAAALTLVLGSAGPALALDELLLIAPAAPGGGWDQTARALQETMQAAGVAKTVTVDNIPGAGGTVGLAQFVDKYKANGSALLVNGLVMVGAILTNNSPVTLDQVTLEHAPPSDALYGNPVFQVQATGNSNSIPTGRLSIPLMQTSTALTASPTS